MCTSASVIFRVGVSSVPCAASLFNNGNLFRVSRQNRRGMWCSRFCTKTSKRVPCITNPIKFQHRFGSAHAATTGPSFPGALSKKQAKELAFKLTPEERQVLLVALQECQSQTLKAEYEGKLAAFRWRSKFGRPTKVASLGDVDPTGSYCAVPEEWLLKKFVETVPHPTGRELVRVSVANAIPFIGFGFLDNFIMIIAGDSIEGTIGSVIVLSTMAAAAFGNTVSDVIGIGSALYVEKLAQRIGFQPPKLTLIQLDLPKSRRAANLGRVLGVTIGCFLGMLPLLVLHKEPKETDLTATTDSLATTPSDS